MADARITAEQVSTSRSSCTALRAYAPCADETHAHITEADEREMRARLLETLLSERERESRGVRLAVVAL